MISKLIACEGPRCNNGMSALVRENALTGTRPGATHELRDDADRHARQIVSRALAVTPHVRSGTMRRGGIAFSLFACQVCQHERVYGNSVNYDV